MIGTQDGYIMGGFYDDLYVGLVHKTHLKQLDPSY